jgi:hypothetical protein
MGLPVWAFVGKGAPVLAPLLPYLSHDLEAELFIESY